MTTKGPCKYCGQVNIINAPEDISEEILIERCTLNCSCDLAKEYKALVERKEQALITLEVMFKGLHSESIEIPDKAYDMCVTAVTNICNGSVDKVTIHLPSQGRISISNSAGKIKIEHSETNKKQMIV